MDFIKRLWGKLLCLTGDHDWTCKAQEGIKPDKDINWLNTQSVLEGFKSYSKMYCKRCGCVSKLN